MPAPVYDELTAELPPRETTARNGQVAFHPLTSPGAIHLGPTDIGPRHCAVPTLSGISRGGGSV